MPIINIQRRLHEDGRIRIGAKVATSKGGTRPSKLETFRFTSRNERAIRAIAAEYGGEPTPWPEGPGGGQWEVYTTSAEIDVVVPPESMSFSQHYEEWSGGGCLKRCDGEWESIGDRPCVCDPEHRECKPHTRLSVMLARYPGTGLWRLDTQGYYAATELGGAMEIVGMLGEAIGRSVIPARLRLEQRTVKRPDEAAKNFAVPVLEVAVDMAALAQGNVAEIAGHVTPVPRDDTPALPLAEQLVAPEGATRARRANSGPEVPATGRRPRPAAEVGTGEIVETPMTGKATTRSMNKLRAALRDIQITSDCDVHDVVSAWVGREVTSLKDCTQAEVNHCISQAEEQAKGMASA